MYKKILFALVSFVIISFGHCFAQSPVDYTKKSSITKGEVSYSSLFGDKEYIGTWSGYNKDSCGKLKTVEIKLSELPKQLEENTIYILNTNKIVVNRTIVIGNCTAVIGNRIFKDKPLIDVSKYSGDVFVIEGKYSIIDYVQISGEQKSGQYGIKIDDTDSITINDVKITGLFGGIYSNNSHHSKYSNINVNHIFEHPFILNKSNNNEMVNINISYGIDEAGIQIEKSSDNHLKNIKSYYNGFQGLYLKGGDGNIMDNVEIFGNNEVGLWIRYGSKNVISNINTYGNKFAGVEISSQNNEIDGLVSYNNDNGIEILESDNVVKNFHIYNNDMNGIYVSGDNNSIDSGLIFNNKLHGIQLNNSNYNTFSKIYDFNNGVNGKSGSRCGIMLYHNSSDNHFNGGSIYNNLIGICASDDSQNYVKDMKIFNNGKIDYKQNKSAEIVYSEVLTQFTGLQVTDLVGGKTGNIGGKTGNIGGKTGNVNLSGIANNTGISANVSGNIIGTGNHSLSGIVLIKTGHGITQVSYLPSFDYMINPYKDGQYLYNWVDGYKNIIGYQVDFAGINGGDLSYSIGINLQDNVSGHIVSNGTNVVAYGKINYYVIGGANYAGNKIRHTLAENININDISNTVATNIDKENVHAVLSSDIKDPSCNVIYSTTLETTENVTAMLTGCSEEIAGADLEHIFTENGSYTFEFKDLVGNIGIAEAKVSRIKQKPSSNGGGGGGGANGGPTTETENTTEKTITNEHTSPKFDFDQAKFDPSFSDEMNMAYQYAYHYKITTQSSISEAGMNLSLSRIAMAKMLSMYAMNVLGKKPANVMVPKFSDVPNELDKQYDNGLTLAYQLGIMGINMPDDKFRPNDLVTRAEFATALSRLLYGTVDGNDFYYTTHLKKLFEKGIIVNADSNLQELRGYVMIMLMRSALGINDLHDFDYSEAAEDGQKITKYFTEPYKKGQIYRKIGDLQDLLRYLGYYKLDTNYVYSKATINAVYDFQVDMGLIDADDVNNPARGYLGPETRNALNEKWAKFQNSIQ